MTSMTSLNPIALRKAKIVYNFGLSECNRVKPETKTRTVRKSDYTPAFALQKHMAGILDEKCKEKEKYREEQIGECPFAIPQYNLLLQTSIPNLKFLS